MGKLINNVQLLSFKLRNRDNFQISNREISNYCIIHVMKCFENTFEQDYITRLCSHIRNRATSFLVKGTNYPVISCGATLITT